MMETTNKMARNEPRVDGTWEITVPHEEDWLAEDIEQARTEYHDQTEHGWGKRCLKGWSSVWRQER
ncbi:hypothetical protein [Paenibacillus glucanolyticus]|uniref:hypothetical protein n=1 Tax=Paenibacillus glucanolyticus TaxID=59843 RepID=UPI002115FF10|nr:hypothetical protein [Paenibacillus glucanolyticus]